MIDLDGYRCSKEDAPLAVLLQSHAWRPFVTLIETWYRTPLSGKTGVSTSLLDELERRFGRKMPAALREWYRLYGAHELLRDESAQDFEMPLERIGESDRWLVIYAEHQECFYCGILNEHCDVADPPVYFDPLNSFDPVIDHHYDPVDLVDGRLIHVTDHLIDFVFGMALRQTVIRLEASPFMRPDVCGASFGRGDDAALVRARFGTQRMLDFPAGFHPEFDGADLILIEDWGFAARTPTVFEAVKKALGRTGNSLKHVWHAE